MNSVDTDSPGTWPLPAVLRRCWLGGGSSLRSGSLAQPVERGRGQGGRRQWIVANPNSAPPPPLAVQAMRFRPYLCRQCCPSPLASALSVPPSRRLLSRQPYLCLQSCVAGRRIHRGIGAGVAIKGVGGGGWQAPIRHNEFKSHLRAIRRNRTFRLMGAADGRPPSDKTS